jgi:hypothetical protein
MITKTLAYISSFTILLPMICGLLSYKYHKSEKLSAFFFLILLGVFTEFITIYLAFYGYYNHIV